MSKKRWTIIVTVGAALLIIGAIALWNDLQKRTWIAQQVFTPAMSETLKRSSSSLLKATKLSSGPQKIDGETVYSAIYYPECRTVLAAVELPDFKEAAFYLVFEDNTTVSGWYMPELVKHNITHVAFESLESQDFAYLDFVDQATIATGNYNPTDDTVTRTRFTLAIPPAPPVSWAHPASSSQASSTTKVK